MRSTSRLGYYRTSFLKLAQDFFAFIARDTMAENATLKIEKIPARVRIIEVKENVLVNNDLEIFPISAKTGQGIDAWAEWLRQEISKWCPFDRSK